MENSKDMRRAERRAEARKHAERAMDVAEWKRKNAAKLAASQRRFNETAERYANMLKFESVY